MKTKLKQYLAVALFATLSSSTPNLNYKPFFHEINPLVLIQQITESSSRERETHSSKDIQYEQVSHKSTTYHIVKIANDNQYNIGIKTSNSPKYLEDFVDENSIAGINGSFFTKEKTIGLVKSNGEEVNPQVRIRGSGYFTVKDGLVEIKKTLEDTVNYDDILQSFPILIYDGEKQGVENGKRSYRSAIALDEHRDVHLITTDTHPFSLKNKITLEQFTDFLHERNYIHALNLDGGKCAQQYFLNNNLRNHRRINNAIVIDRR